jgi:hypothetical protein
MALYLEEAFGKEVPWNWIMVAHLPAIFCLVYVHSQEPDIIWSNRLAPHVQFVYFGYLKSPAIVRLGQVEVFAFLKSDQQTPVSCDTSFHTADQPIPISVSTRCHAPILLGAMNMEIFHANWSQISGSGEPVIRNCV